MTSPALRQILRVREHRLPNGLRVRLVPNDRVATATYFTFFRVGARNEQPGQTGISHLFEHMMFNGTKKHPAGQFDRLVESSGGNSNAFTSNDVTAYYADIASDSLGTVIELEADRMKNLVVTDRILSTERDVVLEERRLRVDNDVLGLMDEELSSLVWKAHPYRWPVIGWRKDIESISREQCLAYFRTYYAPNNAAIYVSGNFDAKWLLAEIDRRYAGIRKGPPPPAVLDAEPEQFGERRAVVQYPAQAPSLMIGFRAPRAADPDTVVLDVLQYGLGVGHASRLWRELVYRRQLAVTVVVDWQWRIDPGLFVIHLELEPGRDVREVEAALYAELAAVGNEGFTVDELERAKNNLVAHLLRELETNAGRAQVLGMHETVLGSWKGVLALPEAYRAVTAEQVKSVAAKTLLVRNRSVVALEPGESGV